MRLAITLFLCGLSLDASANVHAIADDATEPARLALGVNVLGGQLDYKPTRATRLEVKAQAGSASSDAGTVHSTLAALRAYGSFRVDSAYEPYLGAEFGLVQSHIAGGAYNASGGEGGVFGGIERRLFARTWLGLDIGPYVYSMKEKTTGSRDTTVVFVANIYLLLYLF